MAARVLGQKDGESGFIGSIGVRFMIGGDESGGGFSLVEHPMSGRALLGDDVVVGGPGDLIFKPRNQWHTFWNAGDEPARLLEIISPAGFERYFAELVSLGGSTEADPQTLRALAERYGLEVAPQSIPDLLQRFELVFPGEPL
jgi:hypothetical protein